MPEVTSDSPQVLNPSPLPTSSESSKDANQNKKTLIVGAGLVVAMLILVGVTFYSLRSGSSTSTSSTSSSSASQSAVSDKSLDSSISQVSGDFSNVDNEVNNVNDGLNDKQTDLTY